MKIAFRYDFMFFNPIKFAQNDVCLCPNDIIIANIGTEYGIRIRATSL